MMDGIWIAYAFEKVSPHILCFCVSIAASQKFVISIITFMLFLPLNLFSTVHSGDSGAELAREYPV